MESLNNKKRVHCDSDESEFNSPEAKRIQHDLLDSDENVSESETSQDLDSFIKSFENEIPPPPPPETASDSGESKPDLEFLLEASDDELGLPPTESGGGPGFTFGEFSWLDEQLPNYDAFEYGYDHINDDFNGNGEYVALEGLFEYTDPGFGSSDLTRRPESLPA